MATSYGFNWSWMATAAETNRASSVVSQGGGTIFSFNTPSTGAISSSDLNAFVRSVAQNLQSIRSDWRNYTHPILNSLPAGNTDARWSTAAGKGLPEKIDCFVYGIQGSTLFVFNDADATKADGRYWDSATHRPKTIAEKFEDVYEAIANVSGETAAGGTVDLDPLWAAIGEGYRDGSYVGAVGSLDTRTGTLETYVAQLNKDIYDPDVYPTYQLGTPLKYSIADQLDAILKLHNVSGGWGANPAGVSHAGLPVAAHTHPFTDIKPPPPAAAVQARVGPYTSLENEVKRLRYEIQAVKGSSSWYSDAVSPWAPNPTVNLQQHVNYTGSGTVSATNPHGVHYTNTGADAVFDVVRAFTGMDSNTDATPDYAHTNYVTQNAPLETAIGELDNALYNWIGTTVVRQDYSYDRSHLSETEREQTPVVINHGTGRKPIIHVLDVTPEEQDYWGMYGSPAVDLNVVHLDNNTVQIWTGAAVIEVIALF
jgi:hypothetical protein